MKYFPATLGVDECHETYRHGLSDHIHTPGISRWVLAEGAPAIFSRFITGAQVAY